jgi:hypothetical protein
MGDEFYQFDIFIGPPKTSEPTIVYVWKPALDSRLRGACKALSSNDSAYIPPYPLLLVKR